MLESFLYVVPTLVKFTFYEAPTHPMTRIQSYASAISFPSKRLATMVPSVDHRSFSCGVLRRVSRGVVAGQTEVAPEEKQALLYDSPSPETHGRMVLGVGHP